MPCFRALALVALTQLVLSRSQAQRSANAPRRREKRSSPEGSSEAGPPDLLAGAKATALVAASAPAKLAQSAARHSAWEAAEVRRLQEGEIGDTEGGADDKRETLDSSKLPGQFKEGAAKGRAQGGAPELNFKEGEEKESEETARGVEEKEEAEEEAGEGEEAEEEFSAVDIGISWMLLGSVAFTMMLFYLVNYGDDDIRRYSWSIISTTISIFTAVLMFGGINEFIVDLIPGGDWVNLLTGYVLLILWFTLTQVSIAFGSGLCERRGSYTPVDTNDTNEFVWVIADGMRADFGEPVDERWIRNTSGSKGVAIREEGVEIFVHKKAVAREMRERQAKGFSILLAHMTGFAAISAGGNLQHVPFFEQNAGTALLAVAFNWGLLYTLSRITDCIRERCFVSSAGMEENAKLFDEEAEDAENDVASLSISFLTVQAFRFQLTGALPGVKPEVAQSSACVQALYGGGLACALGAVVLVVCQRGEPPRILEIFQNVLGMSFAWCVLWASRWLALGWRVLSSIGCSPETMQGRVLLALVLSGMALIFIFVLDKVEDAAGGHSRLDRVIQNIVNALSILVGLSWEYCFDGGLEAVVSVTDRPLLIKLVFTFLVAMIILPAWKRYILVKIMTLTKYREEVRAAKRDAGELTTDPTSLKA